MEKEGNVLENLASLLCGQLLNYIRARINMMDVYEKLVPMSALKFIVFDEVISALANISSENSKLCPHPLLSPIRNGLSHECDALFSLLKAHDDIQHWRFLPSLFNLNDAQAKLNAWATVSINRDVS